MHHSPRTVPESSRRSVMFVEKMDSDRTGLVASCNWLIGLVCKDEKRLNLTTLGDLHRIHLAHHGPSVLIQLGPTVPNTISDPWWPCPTHHHSSPSCPSRTTRHAGPDTLVVANTHQEVIQDCTSTPLPTSITMGSTPPQSVRSPLGEV